MDSHPFSRMGGRAIPSRVMKRDGGVAPPAGAGPSFDEKLDMFIEEMEERVKKLEKREESPPHSPRMTEEEIKERERQTDEFMAKQDEKDQMDRIMLHAMGVMTGNQLYKKFQDMESTILGLRMAEDAAFKAKEQLDKDKYKLKMENEELKKQLAAK